MEKKLEKWGFKNQKAGNPTIRDTLETIKGHLSKSEERALIHLGHGDPSSYPSFRTTPVAYQRPYVHSLQWVLPCCKKVCEFGINYGFEDNA